MIANFFNKTKPINFLVLSGLMIVVYFIGVGNYLEWDFSFSFFFAKSVYLVLAVLVIFFLNFIIRKNMLTDHNTYALFFIICLFGFFLNSFFDKNIFIANFILLFAFRRIYSLRSIIQSKEKIFDSAFWIGVASLFYSWSILYVLLLYSAVWIFKKRDWKNIFIPFIGFITPVFLLFVYLLLKNDEVKLGEFWNFDHSFEFENYTFLQYLIPIVFLLILGLIAIFPTTKKSLLSKIDIKSNWNILIIHIFISLIITILAPVKNGSEFLFLFFPLGILFANYLQEISRYWLKELIVYLFLAVIISVHLV